MGLGTCAVWAPKSSKTSEGWAARWSQCAGMERQERATEEGIDPTQDEPPEEVILTE